MANTYFQFKHFRINQELCAMKVCTDACILGAVAPVAEAKTILDIGTGTGLLSLMAAQRSHALIDAVEIDKNAAVQATKNALASNWAGRLTIHHTALQDFVPPNQKKYDVIISNPPFFVNSLRSQNQGERIAKHTDALSFAELISFAIQHLHPQGCLCILLPPAEQEIFASEAHKNSLYNFKNILIRDRPAYGVFRVIGFYAFSDLQIRIEEELVIKNQDGSYSDAFKKLLKDFYLAF